MTDSTISVENQLINFHRKVRKQYVREGRYGPYIGNTENALIQTNTNLTDTSLPLVGALAADGRIASEVLVGNEEPLSNYAMRFNPTHHRHGVTIDNEEREKSNFDLFSEARPSLTNWMMELKRDQITQALCAVQDGGAYFNYGGGAKSGANGAVGASAANMSAWQGANTDRILYGSSVGNLAAGDHTASLAQIDTTNDKLTPETISLMKRVADDSDPLIRPIKLNGDEPYYVYFVGKYGFRDLKENDKIVKSHQEARERSVSNPLFKGGDLMWDNVIIKEIREMDKFIDGGGSALWSGVWGANTAGDDLSIAGDAASRVGVGFLCGAQALTFGRAKNAMFKRRKEDDYEHLSGVGITAKHDIVKNFYNGKQHGMLTHFHSAIKDA